MFEEEILSRLREMHRSGMSYDEIANTTGVARSALGLYISGSKPIKNPSISLLMKVFPNCRIDLNGGSPPPANQETGISEADAGKIAEDAVKAFRQRLVMALIPVDMPPEIALDVLKIVRNME